MRIINKREMLKLPNGTVFMTYSPDMTDGEVKIKIGYYISDSGKPNWNVGLSITPFFRT